MNETQTQEKRAPGGTGERLCSIPYEAALDAFFWIQHALDGRDVPDHQCEQVQKHKRAISQAIHETQESNAKNELP